MKPKSRKKFSNEFEKFFFIHAFAVPCEYFATKWDLLKPGSKKQYNDGSYASITARSSISFVFNEIAAVSEVAVSLVEDALVTIQLFDDHDHPRGPTIVCELIAEENSGKTWRAWLRVLHVTRVLTFICFRVYYAHEFFSHVSDAWPVTFCSSMYKWIGTSICMSIAREGYTWIDTWLALLFSWICTCTMHSVHMIWHVNMRLSCTWIWIINRHLISAALHVNMHVHYHLLSHTIRVKDHSNVSTASERCKGCLVSSDRHWLVERKTSHTHHLDPLIISTIVMF